MTAPAFSVRASRSSHGFRIAMRNAEFVCCVPVRKLNPSICSTFSTAGSSAISLRAVSDTSSVRGRLAPGGSCTAAK